VTSGHGHPAVTAASRLVPGLEVPASLAGNVAEDEEDGPARRAWLEALPRVVADLADRWSLRVGRPFQPGGNASWVAPARDTSGRHLVLKAGWRHDEAEDEAARRRRKTVIGQGLTDAFPQLLQARDPCVGAVAGEAQQRRQVRADRLAGPRISAIVRPRPRSSPITVTHHSADSS